MPTPCSSVVSQVRKAALRMALVRALVRSAMIIKTSKLLRDNKDLKITDIFDMAMKQVTTAETRPIALRSRTRCRHAAECF